MRVKGPDGRSYVLDLKGREVGGEDLVERSAGHRYATNLLQELLPLHRLYQEVPLEGSETRLVVDLLVPALKLGVEVQGRQHREYSPFHHGTMFGWLHQRRRDRLKREWFLLNGWTLVALHDNEHSRWPSQLRAALAGRNESEALTVGNLTGTGAGDSAES